MNIFLLYISFIASLVSTDNPELTLKIQNIQKLQGEIVIGVFNTDKDFLKSGVAIRNYKISVDNATESLTIKDLPVGDYAISLYHDENSDGECNRNFIGIPKEPYAFSNNFKPRMSAPKFEDCKFSLRNDQTLEIKLIQ